MKYDWQHRIDRPNAPAVPVLAARMHRVFWVPPRYRSIAAVALDGNTFTYRALAARTRYSLKGVYAALHAMQRMGFGTLRTKRGRGARSRFVLQSDVSVQKNVSTTVRTSIESLSKSVAVVETFFSVPVSGLGSRSWTAAMSGGTGNLSPLT